MWDNLTEIKYNIFAWLANNFFFYSNIYISVNTIFECCYLFFGWEIGRPLSTYATGGMEKSHPKCAQVRTGGGELKNHDGSSECLSAFGWSVVFFFGIYLTAIQIFYFISCLENFVFYYFENMLKCLVSQQTLYWAKFKRCIFLKFNFNVFVCNFLYIYPRNFYILALKFDSLI